MTNSFLPERESKTESRFYYDTEPLSLGPVTIEALICSLVGLLLVSALSTLLVSLSLWTILFALIGLGSGFLVAHYHFPADNQTNFR
ncbi:hypothetical protein PT277_02440 [Acetobacteraceae bacterium ESL0709]|nr:hypothetical protein [Acetobacteraceae bacterium ESL0697]MDF7677561.1 hypothetical protein [Acetobacteraceae bacterium ESL0709]